MAVEDIINEAVQEGKIESELAKIDISWREHSLTVVKYKKDGQERGFVLRAAEELKLGEKEKERDLFSRGILLILVLHYFTLTPAFFCFIRSHHERDSDCGLNFINCCDDRKFL